jgi:mRNA interferase RelE/StbE
MKTIVLTHRAAKELDALPKEDRFAVTEALTLYAIEGRGDVKRLAGRDGCRLRVRDCRVIFDDDGVTLLAIHIGRRTMRPIRGLQDESPDHYQPQRRRARRAAPV